MSSSTGSVLDVVVIGAGFGGLCMALKLKQAGYSNFVVFEKEADVGGAWRDNVYPGCACDVASHLYSFSFEQNPNWTRMYPTQPELFAYLKHCVDKHRLHQVLRTNSEVVGATWDADTALWTVTLADGSSVRTRVLVPAMGVLNRPRHPNIPGLESFAGPTFHSARWRHDVDLAGKTVAVLGTGASAIQFVPKIAPIVGKLLVFQRSPAWVMPHPDRAMKTWEMRVFRWVPLAQRYFRWRIYMRQEKKGKTRIERDLQALGGAKKVGLAHLAKHIKDDGLRERLTPTYQVGCKRILLSNEYYPTLTRDNVELVTEPITEVRDHGVVAGDATYPVDVLIYGTGFKATEPLPSNLRLVGRDGRVLNDEWMRGGEAYYGIAVTGYPNLFFIMGPNTYLGHNSIVFMIESQVRYIIQALKLMRRKQLRTLEVRPEVQRAFNEWLADKSKQSVWMAGCQSWYLTDDGKNTTLWPDHTYNYWRALRRVALDDYHVAHTG
jgi:cation diffusion facilitator CzcD-associated flavoprotein CzcO